MDFSPEKSSPVKVLWDGSGVWGVMCIEGWWGAGVWVEPVWARELAAGVLNRAGMLVVPGGWPRLKLQALIPQAREAIREFIFRGGWYVGLCGGAGVGLKGGLGLVEMERAGAEGRVALLSGPVRVRKGGGEWFWGGLGEEEVFHVWWPGQFGEVARGVEVVATYSGPEPGLVSGEQEVISCRDWRAAERKAGVRLNPQVIWGRPAVVCARMGRGMVVLSYLHLDTPGHPPAARVLRNISRAALGSIPPAPLLASNPSTRLGRKMAEAGERLVAMGERLRILRPRGVGMPVLARGRRGLELVSLGWMMRAGGCWAGPGQEQVLARAWADVEEVVERAEEVWGAIAADPSGADPQWFPAPRRWGGALAKALKALEELTFTLARSYGT